MEQKEQMSEINHEMHKSRKSIPKHFYIMLWLDELILSMIYTQFNWNFYKIRQLKTVVELCEVFIHSLCLFLTAAV